MKSVRLDNSWWMEVSWEHRRTMRGFHHHEHHRLKWRCGDEIARILVGSIVTIVTMVVEPLTSADPETSNGSGCAEPEPHCRPGEILGLQGRFSPQSPQKRYSLEAMNQTSPHLWRLSPKVALQELGLRGLSLEVGCDFLMICPSRFPHISYIWGFKQSISEIYQWLFLVGTWGLRSAAKGVKIMNDNDLTLRWRHGEEDHSRKASFHLFH